MKLSKIEALEKTRVMWQWLADHPSSVKSDFVALHPEYEAFQASCTCCEYTRVEYVRPYDDAYDKAKDEGECGLCPLRDFWAAHGRVKDVPFCGDSVFKKWCDTTDPVMSKRYAQQIADGCTEELKRLKPNGSN